MLSNVHYILYEMNVKLGGSIISQTILIYNLVMLFYLQNEQWEEVPFSWQYALTDCLSEERYNITLKIWNKADWRLRLSRLNARIKVLWSN